MGYYLMGFNSHTNDIVANIVVKIKILQLG